MALLFRLLFEEGLVIDDEGVVFDVGGTDDEDNVDEDRNETGCDSVVINWEDVEGIC